MQANHSYGKYFRRQDAPTGVGPGGQSRMRLVLWQTGCSPGAARLSLMICGSVERRDTIPAPFEQRKDAAVSREMEGAHGDEDLAATQQGL